jgi:hypothetical protein
MMGLPEVPKCLLVSTSCAFDEFRLASSHFFPPSVAIVQRKRGKRFRTWSAFGLGEKFVFEPYTEEMFQNALRFAEKWNLHTHVQDNQYDHLIVVAGI